MNNLKPKKTEDKLGELLLKGWTMLNETCSIESCQCPLMQNINGQKYCCQCEMWLFDNQKKREKKKFTDLICVPQPKQKEQTKKNDDNKSNQNNLKNVLETKMTYLTQALINETDFHQIEIITRDINLILDACKKIEEIEK